MLKSILKILTLGTGNHLFFCNVIGGYCDPRILTLWNCCVYIYVYIYICILGEHRTSWQLDVVPSDRIGFDKIPISWIIKKQSNIDVYSLKNTVMQAGHAITNGEDPPSRNDWLISPCCVAVATISCPNMSQSHGKWINPTYFPLANRCWKLG